MAEGDGELQCPESTEELFSALKPYCAKLLDLLRTSSRTAPFLPEMAGLLRRAPPRLLQPLLDYILIPLLLLLDAAVECRSGKEGASDAMRDLRVSDVAAEGVLTCLKELLRKCRIVSVAQMLSVLKKLTKGGMLLPSEASEELREGIVLCLRALLLNLGHCAVESCLCKEVSFYGLLTDGDMLMLQLQDNVEYHTESKECLLSFLRSQDASAAVGHLLSLLFQTAEMEVARGLRGSSKLRKEALLTLRVLVAKVGSSDALAFFLPGVVSRFSKALHDSKNTLSGAAGSFEGIDHAVRGLAEFLTIVLKDEANHHALISYLQNSDCLDQNENQTSHTIMEMLRGFSLHQERRDESTKLVNNMQSADISGGSYVREVNAHNSPKSMVVNRTANWLKETAVHVGSFLSATFPNLCNHPSERVRKGVLDATKFLLINCRATLTDSKLMFLEFLCILVCDDSETVSVAAHDALTFLLTSYDSFFTEHEINEGLNGLIQKLPKIILGNDETVAISHTQKLFALMYYLGPEQLISSILSSPMKVRHFLDVLASCMSPNSQFAGPVRRLMLSSPLKVGYLHSVRELQAGPFFDRSKQGISSDSFWNPTISLVKGDALQNVSGTVDYKIPSIPPWCTHPGSQKLYTTLAGIVHLVSLSILSGKKTHIPLSVVIDAPLDSVRKLISDIRMKEFNKESWKSWYARYSSGQLLRNASTAACILNEIIYAISEESVHLLYKLFNRSWSRLDEHERTKDNGILSSCRSKETRWSFVADSEIMDNLVHCVGNILHEYMAHEIWDLPKEYKSFLSQHNEEDPPLYLFHDSTVLNQIVIEGIAVFNLSLGINFKASGFMHNSLFLLLQNLICANNQVKTACDAVLRAISAANGFSTVGDLVVANADYVVDCLCRSLRHLDVDPRIPNVLSAMLSFIGVAEEILPLLEEPMRIVSLELEVVGRWQRPNLTDPFLKALLEITKASKHEASHFPSKYESFCMDIKSKVLHMKNKNITYSSGNADVELEQWKDLLFKLNEMRIYRRIVGSVAGSCLRAAIPLMASKRDSVCLVALDVVECGSIAVANVEKAYKLEKESKEAIDEAVKICLYQHLEESDDLSDESDENRVLPAMNKIWPYLIICIKNKSSVAVIRRCMHVLSSIIQISGGDFFVRRFRSDGTSIWKLLSCSPFWKKSPSQNEGRKILLPYRGAVALEEPVAEASNLKVQEAALIMIAELAGNTNTATALEAVFKKVSGLVVGIACSTLSVLREASRKALSGLASMDADLIWLLVADIYFSLKKANVPPPPTSTMPCIHELLPQPPSPKDYLYLQYGGEGFGFDIDPSAVEAIFLRMQSQELDRALER